MTPLGGALLGMVVVALDFRVNGFDLLADPVGWVVLAISVGRLARLDGWFGAATAVACVGAVASLFDLVGPNESQLWVISETILQTLVLFALCSGMIRHLAGGHPAIGQLQVIRWIDLGTTALMLAVTLPGGTLAGAGVLVAILVYFGIAIWFFVVAGSVRALPPLSGAAAAAA